VDKQTKIYVAGHRGLVGGAIMRGLAARGYERIVVRTHQELDLQRQEPVERFFAQEKPQCVILAAAHVGGIHANNVYRGDFIHDNLMIQLNVIQAALKNQVAKLLFLGSSCIYPRDCPQPMKEEYLLTGPLEQTNEPYAIAKIAGIKLCESFNRQHKTNYLSVMPTNLYGPGDNYDLNNSHVLPAMIRKFHQAKEQGNAPVQVWGSGTPLREFLHNQDMADACLFVMERITTGDAPGDLYNVGSGEEVTIRQLALTVQRVVGHEGPVVWDASKPDGTPRKLLDCSRLAGLGWKARISLEEGLKATYQHFLSVDSKRYAQAAT